MRFQSSSLALLCLTAAFASQAQETPPSAAAPEATPPQAEEPSRPDAAEPVPQPAVAPQVPVSPTEDPAKSAETKEAPRPFRGRLWLQPPGFLDDSGAYLGLDAMFAGEATDQLMLTGAVAVDWYSRQLVYRHAELGAKWRPSGWARGDGLSLFAYPFNSQRLRLGFDPVVAFGSGRASAVTSAGDFGARAEVRRGPFLGWVALKTWTALNHLRHEQERQYAPLVGASYTALPGLTVEANLARFPTSVGDLGATYELALRTPAMGAAARVSYAMGRAVPVLFDLERYRGVNEVRDLFFDEGAPGTGFGLRLSAEALHVRQTLISRFQWGELVDVGATAAQVRATAGVGHALLQATLSYRDAMLPFYDNDLAPLATQAFEMSEQAQRYASVAAEYCWAQWSLCPGLTARLELPAAYQPDPADPLGTGGRWVVVADVTRALSVLPTGSAPRPVWSVTPSLRWEPVRHLTLFGQVTYENDSNRTYFVDDTGAAEPTWDSPHVFRMDAILALTL